MKKLLSRAAVATCSIALVVACSSRSDDAGPGGDDGGSKESSSGASGESGTSSGDTGTSSGDAAKTDGNVAPSETPCDPAKTDCKPGEVCTDVSRAAFVCRAGCKNDAECAAATPASGCILLTAGSPITGGCIPTCKPYGTDCAAGYTCTRPPEQANVAQTSKKNYCRKTGATGLNQSCVADPAACGENADCIFFSLETVNDSKCHTLCDAAHPCGAGKGNCLTMTGDTFGFCNQG